MDTDKKAPTPPYVAYKTLKNFLEKYKQGLLPSRIDRDLMGTMSGAVQSQVTTALKYLRFISDNSVTTDKMRSKPQCANASWRMPTLNARAPISSRPGSNISPA